MYQREFIPVEVRGVKIPHSVCNDELIAGFFWTNFLLILFVASDVWLTMPAGYIILYLDLYRKASANENVQWNEKYMIWFSWFI